MTMINDIPVNSVIRDKTEYSYKGMHGISQDVAISCLNFDVNFNHVHRLDAYELELTGNEVNYYE